MSIYKGHKLRVLSTFSLAMITIGSVDSIRNLPSTALFGTSLIFFFLLGAAIFLIPAALMSAELASGWPQKGGVYVWVREAFGPWWGFLAIWFQWVENIIWYPTLLSFIAGTIVYVLNPNLAENQYVIFFIILLVFWGVTLVNMRGMEASARFSSICGIGGLVVPLLFIMGLGVYWLFTGQPLQISFSAHAWLPNLIDSDAMVSMTGVILCFCGIEIAAVHVSETKNPQKDYPKALLISVLFILVTLIIGALAIAIVVPRGQLNLISGVMQAFSCFLNAYHMVWMMPLIACAIILGGLGGLNNWIIAPTKGLMIAFQDLKVPGLQKENQFGSPGVLLFWQAIIVSFIALLFLFAPNINSAYWMLTALTSQLYMFMYALMFLAGIYLRFLKPSVKRGYKIPGGKAGISMVGILGLFSCFFTLLIGFHSPSGMSNENNWHYAEIMLSGLLLSILPAVLIYQGFNGKKLVSIFSRKISLKV